MHLAEFESSIHEKFRINFSYEDKSRFDYWERTSFTFDQWLGLKEHCEMLNLEFIVSPFSIEACRWLRKMEVKKVKIGSGETSNSLMLDYLKNFSSEIIFSTGLSNHKEIEEAYNILSKKVKNISILHCITKYPSLPSDWNLKRIKDLKNLFPDAKIGYSDHSGEIYSSIAAIVYGAEIIEFHVTFDKKIFGPDSKASLTIEEVKQLVNGGNKIFKSKHSRSKTIINNNLKNIFGKSLALNKDKLKGEVVQYDDLETKKPGNMGISASEYKLVIGKVFKKNIKSGAFLKYTYFE
jgi:N-acetylneuraminate synthase